MSTAKPVFTFWRVVGILVLLAIATLATLVITSAMAQPTISVDYAKELANLAREYQPEHTAQPNRRDEFIDTILDMNRIKDDRFPDESIDVQTILEPEPEDTKPNPLVEEPTWEDKRRRAELYLDTLDNDGFFDRAEKLSDIRHAVNELPEGVSVLHYMFSENVNPLEHLGPMRALARTLSIQAVREARAGNTDEALRRIESAYATARLASTEPFLISGLVGVACHTAAASNAIRIVTEHRLTTDQLDELRRIAHRQRLTPFEHAIRTEKTILLDAVQRTYTDNGKGDGYLLVGHFSRMNSGLGANPIPAANAMNVLGRFLPSRAETVDAIDRMFDAAADFTRNPSHDTTKLDATIAAVVADTENHMLLSILLPAINRAAQNSTHIVTTDAALTTAIALEHHHIDHNAYPDTLDALVPAYLDELPRDPLARDGRLIYTPAEDRAAYTLHAVGPNAKDDAGNEDDLTFTPQ